MDHLKPIWATVSEAAFHLRCCRQTIRNRIANGTIPYRVDGARYLIHRSVLEEGAPTWQNEKNAVVMPSGKTTTVQFPASQSQR